MCELYTWLLLSCSVMSSSLQPHGLQHARLPCPSLPPGVCSNSLSFESVMPPNHLVLCCPLLLLPSIFPSIRVFPVSWLFVSGGQNIGASASASVLSTNIQGWFPLGWTVLISLQSNRLSRTFSNTTVHKHQFLVLSLLYGPTLTSVYDYWKNHSFDYTDLCKPSHVSRDRNGPPVLGAQSPSLWTKREVHTVSIFKAYSDLQWSRILYFSESASWNLFSCTGIQLTEKVLSGVCCLQVQNEIQHTF